MGSSRDIAIVKRQVHLQARQPPGDGHLTFSKKIEMVVIGGVDVTFTLQSHPYWGLTHDRVVEMRDQFESVLGREAVFIEMLESAEGRILFIAEGYTRYVEKLRKVRAECSSMLRRIRHIEGLLFKTNCELVVVNELVIRSTQQVTELRIQKVALEAALVESNQQFDKFAEAHRIVEIDRGMLRSRIACASTAEQQVDLLSDQVRQFAGEMQRKYKAQIFQAAEFSRVLNELNVIKSDGGSLDVESISFRQQWSEAVAECRRLQDENVECAQDAEAPIVEARVATAIYEPPFNGFKARPAGRGQFALTNGPQINPIQCNRGHFLVDKKPNKVVWCTKCKRAIAMKKHQQCDICGFHLCADCLPLPVKDVASDSNADSVASRRNIFSTPQAQSTSNIDKEDYRAKLDRRTVEYVAALESIEQRRKENDHLLLKLPAQEGTVAVQKFYLNAMQVDLPWFEEAWSQLKKATSPHIDASANDTFDPSFIFQWTDEHLEENHAIDSKQVDPYDVDDDSDGGEDEEGYCYEEDAEEEAANGDTEGSASEEDAPPPPRPHFEPRKPKREKTIASPAPHKRKSSNTRKSEPALAEMLVARADLVATSSHRAY